MVSDLEISSPLGKSDHSCITFWFNCYLETKSNNYEKFLYDKGNYDAIKEDLNIDWEVELDKRKTVNEKWKFISNKISNSTEKNIPKIKKIHLNDLRGKLFADVSTFQAQNLEMTSNDVT